jgi:hypothetical protein
VNCHRTDTDLAGCNPGTATRGREPPGALITTAAETDAAMTVATAAIQARRRQFLRAGRAAGSPGFAGAASRVGVLPLLAIVAVGSQLTASARGSPVPPKLGGPATAASAGGRGGAYRPSIAASDAGSQPASWPPPTSASRSPAVGRWPGSFARHRSANGRISPGTPSRFAGLWTTRYTSAAVDPVPNGPLPVAAKARTAPRLNTSLGGPTSQPSACSGDMNPAEPITKPPRVSDVASAAWEIPKSGFVSNGCGRFADDGRDGARLGNDRVDHMTSDAAAGSPPAGRGPPRRALRPGELGRHRRGSTGDRLDTPPRCRARRAARHRKPGRLEARNR